MNELTARPTGEPVMYRDTQGNLMKAQSWVTDDMGTVETHEEIVEAAVSDNTEVAQ